WRSIFRLKWRGSLTAAFLFAKPAGGRVLKVVIETPAQTIESVSGLIERVTFFNEESGFAVLKVKVKGRRDLVTVVGTVAAVTPGEWLTAEGFWAHNKEHGFELRAQKLRAVPPTTREGIERYLGSGMVKGIGPKYAQKLVERFGEEIFSIIENF